MTLYLHLRRHIPDLCTQACETLTVFTAEPNTTKFMRVVMCFVLWQLFEQCSYVRLAVARHLRWWFKTCTQERPSKI